MNYEGITDKIYVRGLSMFDMKQYEGLYYYMWLVLEVSSSENQLLATMPGVPIGYDILLETVGKDQFKNHGGPIDGSTVTFTRDEIGQVIGIQVDAFNLTKIKKEALQNLPVIERFPAPKFNLTLDKQAQFEKLVRACLEGSDGSWIEYDLPYPKHEFVQFITAQDRFIFHGSNNTDIEEFQPVRKSMELYDETGRGRPDVAGTGFATG
jgi:hypothetical protein